MDNPFVLAPMAGITDMPFRRLMKRMGAGCVISEFVSSHMVAYKNPRKERYLAFHEEERPVGIQLFGGEEEVLVEAAKIIEARGVDFLDLNLGCPVPKVTKKGGGSAWLCNPVELGKLLVKLVDALSIPVTIKIRTGWDHSQINAQEIIRIAYESGVHWVAVHGRTRAQGYSGLADWDLMRELGQGAPLPLIGNGDIISGPLAAARLEQSGLDGVMIGRGALKNPWIFQEAVEAHRQLSEWKKEQKDDFVQQTLKLHRLPSAGDVPEGKNYYQKKVKKLQPVPVNFVADWVKIRADRDAKSLIETHLELLFETYPEVRAHLAFRKFLAWYSAGYPGSHQFRKAIFTTQDFKEVKERALNFFESVKQMGEKADEGREPEPVLMKGHG